MEYQSDATYFLFEYISLVTMVKLQLHTHSFQMDVRALPSIKNPAPAGCLARTKELKWSHIADVS